MLPETCFFFFLFFLIFIIGVFCGLTRRAATTADASRVQLKRDGTRWRTGGEVKGKLENGVGSQSSSHRFKLPRNVVYTASLPLMRTPRLPAIDWTDAPADLNGLVRFAERPNLVSARVPSHFERTLLAESSVRYISSRAFCVDYFIGLQSREKCIKQA